ncbi:MAG: DUF4215 domain-containing protein [Nanoarchaeota archaeon]|nr:DUF4215 domain-containing protein [Nanoarchaeota archaeon]
MGRREVNERGLSTVASAIIIMAMTIAIGVVVIVIYNIVSSELEYSTQSNISLEIQKDSVLINEKNLVSLNVSRGEGNSELEKIRFVLSDGENVEEIERSAVGLNENGEAVFTFTPKLVNNVKTIRIVPIIKVDGKRKYLSVQDSVQISQEGGKTTAEKVTSICGNAQIESGEECDDGNAVSGDGCSMDCKVETTTTTDTSAVCGDGACDSSESCSSCSVDCGVCPAGTQCGNGIKEAGEQCDLGSANTNTACTASYGLNCTYCTTGCVNTTIWPLGYCGDGTCQSANENSDICSTDCPTCSSGDTQSCGSSGAYGTQTCDSGGNWGTCVYSLYTLTTSKSGSGTITSSPSGINCGSTCVKNFSSGDSVTLTATPDSGYTLSSWGGACSGSSSTCVVTMSSAKSVSATFAVSCTPTTCSALGKTCGGWDDGCGGTLNCGTCSADKICSSGTCVPRPSTTCGAFQLDYQCFSTYIGQAGCGASCDESQCRSYCQSVGATCCYWHQDVTNQYCNAFLGSPEPQYIGEYNHAAATCS